MANETVRRAGRSRAQTSSLSDYNVALLLAPTLLFVARSTALKTLPRTHTKVSVILAARSSAAKVKVGFAGKRARVLRGSKA